MTRDTMPTGNEILQGRRVISGLDANGKSTIVSDERSSRRISIPGLEACDLWEAKSLPTHVDADYSLPGELTLGVKLGLPERGLMYRVGAFPANSIGDMHRTDSIDVTTLVSGELWAVLETTETLLKPGDTFIQRGTWHSWKVTGNEPAVFVVMNLAISTDTEQ
jgi:quercetin dioxygenase-like cupin family protein